MRTVMNRTSVQECVHTLSCSPPHKLTQLSVCSPEEVKYVVCCTSQQMIEKEGTERGGGEQKIKIMTVIRASKTGKKDLTK